MCDELLSMYCAACALEKVCVGWHVISDGYFLNMLYKAV